MRWLGPHARPARRAGVLLAPLSLLAAALIAATAWAQAPADEALLLEAAEASAVDAGTADAPDAGPPHAPGAAAEEPPEPMVIHTGIYPVRVADFDLASGQATITYYVWTRWQGEYDGTTYDLMNGTVDTRDHDYTFEDGGVHYAWYRYTATLDVVTDFHDFPLDEHELQIELEHSDYGTYYLRFEVDRRSVENLASPEISGWTVDPPVYETYEHVYPTDWGMPGAGDDDVSRFSRVRWSVRVHHTFEATFAKTFLALFISVLIAFFGFFMHPEELEARIGVCVAGIFGAVTSHAVVAGNLPDIPYMTLSDKIHFAGMAFICLSLLESAYVGYLARRDQVEEGLRFDRLARITLAPAYLVVVVLLTLLR